ncbi:hypothetical protein [Legionella sp. 16cNR16C]|uniref:hypothetical protein n=1 Tax=Legionella sp. 16cNR16C TaxID=2905656 RepID=UPI001E3E1D6F|nr:hypothetical protein [Legionella sp. 16cNR16C]MCE3044441.1 hypothetical protein [Legionella sp. 16cNR16C]
MSSLLPLRIVLGAYNERILRHYASNNPSLSFQQCQQLWKDLLGWMWLTQYRKSLDKATYLFGPLLQLDDLWHFFILNTRDYCEFCERYWGEYFHHDMETPHEAHQLTADELADFLEDAIEFLGEDWIDRYFHHLFTEEN